jgi:hypothetical protein
VTFRIVNLVAAKEQAESIKRAEEQDAAEQLYADLQALLEQEPELLKKDKTLRKVLMMLRSKLGHLRRRAAGGL